MFLATLMVDFLQTKPLSGSINGQAALNFWLIGISQVQLKWWNQEFPKNHRAKVRVQLHDEQEIILR